MADPSNLTDKQLEQAIAERRAAIQGNARTKVGAYQRAQKEKAAVSNRERRAIDAESPGALLKGTGRAAAQGALFGFGDEAIAGVRSLGSDRSYDDLLQEERDAYKRFSTDHPYLATGAEFAGGALPSAAMMLVPGGQAAAVANTTANATRAAGALNRVSRLAASPVVRGGAAGAGYGALSGFGAGEDGFENRAEHALAAAPTGFVLGSALPKLMGAGRVAGAQITERLAPNWDRFADPVGRGRDYVLGQMAKDNLTPADLLAKLAADRKAGVPSKVLDQGPNLTLGTEVASMRGGDGQHLAQELAERNRGNRARTMGQLNNKLAPDDFFDKAEELVARARQSAAPHYDKAYSLAPTVDESPALTKLLNRPGASKIWSEAMGSPDFTLLGKQPGKMIWQDGQRVLDKPSLEALDQYKRAIDRQIELTKKGVANGSATKSDLAALTEYRKQYMNALDESLPKDARAAWSDARNAFRGEMEMHDALNLGRDEFFNMEPQEFQRAIAKLNNPAERDALASGVFEAIRSHYGGATQTLGASPMDPARNVAANLIGDAGTREKLSALIGDPKKAEAMLAALQRESEIFGNTSRVIANSRTEPRRVAGEEFDGNQSGEKLKEAAGAAMSAASGNWHAAAHRLFNVLKSSNLPEARANEVVRIMRAGTPQEVQQVIADLEAHTKARAIQGEQRGRVRNAIATDAANVEADTPYAPPEDVGDE